MGITGTYTRPSVANGTQDQCNPNSFPVIFQTGHSFTPVAESDVPGNGTCSPDFIDTIQPLLEEPNLRLQTSCTLGGLQAQKGKVNMARLGAVSLDCELSIIVYGPEELLNNVGEFFQDLDMYLQDPKDCCWDVKYCNPHRLSSSDINSCPMTSSLGVKDADLDQTLFQIIPGESDVLEVLDAVQDMPEAPQPKLIIPPLKQ